MITFAIPTNIKSIEQKIQLNNLVHSITHQSVQVPYEILVCGNFEHENVTTIDFPEDLNGTAYITRKQNLLVENAKYENIVFLRDYEFLWNDWVDGLLYWNTLNNESWTVMLTPVLNRDGTRFRDVCHWDKPGIGGEWTQYEPWCKEGRVTKGGPHLCPYSDFEPGYCYINGGYFIAKTAFMKNNRWNKNLQWGEAEDVELSLRMRQDRNFNIVINQHSIIQLQKQKDRCIPIYPTEYFGTIEYVISKYLRDKKS